MRLWQSRPILSWRSKIGMLNTSVNRSSLAVWCFFFQHRRGMQPGRHADGEGERYRTIRRQIKVAIRNAQLQRCYSGERHMCKQCTGSIRNLKFIAKPAFRVIDWSWRKICGAGFLLKLAPQGYRMAAKHYNNLLSFLALF